MRKHRNVRFIQLYRIPGSADISDTHTEGVYVYSAQHTKRDSMYIRPKQTKRDSMYIQLNYTQRLRVYVKGRIYTGFVYVAFIVNV